jgi:hypothetical protein
MIFKQSTFGKSSRSKFWEKNELWQKQLILIFVLITEQIVFVSRKGLYSGKKSRQKTKCINKITVQVIENVLVIVALKKKNFFQILISTVCKYSRSRLMQSLIML